MVYLFKWTTMNRHRFFHDVSFIGLMSKCFPNEYLRKSGILFGIWISGCRDGKPDEIVFFSVHLVGKSTHS